MDNTKRESVQPIYLETKNVKQQGISKYKFYQYLKKHGFEQVGQGLYIAKESIVDELFVLHRRCPKAVFSHDEAFYFHGLIDREPSIHTLTLYSGYNTHRLVKDGKCKVYTVKKELVDVGKIIVKDNFGNSIPMYDLERTICDLVRSRNSIEKQEFVSCLKNYVSKKEKNLNRLMEYAGLFKVEKIIQRYLEIFI